MVFVFVPPVLVDGVEMVGLTVGDELMVFVGVESMSIELDVVAIGAVSCGFVFFGSGSGRFAL
jgi:hypothetical protein